MACLGGCFAATGRFSGWDSLVLERIRKNGWIPPGWRARATDRSSSPLWRKAERTGLSLLQWRERVPWELPLLCFYVKEQTSGISSFMVHPLMPWFLSDCGWILSCWGKAFVRPKDSPPFPLFFCSSFSLRWDEFGQNRRGSESTAAPRRGPRVSFTENLKQQQRNFRELKQRVFGHWLGRYTARVLVATPFLLWV